MKKILFFLLLIALIVGVSYYKDYGRTRIYIEDSLITIVNLDKTLLNNKSVAMREARNRFQESIANGVSLAEGPCLAELLVPGWSLDIVHNPKEAIDREREHQCKYFLDGLTERLIEYDTIGNFIRIVERQ